MEVLDREELLVQAQELDPLPATVTRLASLVADPNSNMEDIVEAISLDSALTVKLLRVANSAASGAASEITTVDQAVMRVGTGSVLSMAVAAGVRARMVAELPAYGFEEGELWQHSVAAALAAESLRGLVPVDLPPESFTAALLHDVGKLVLCRYLGAQLAELVRRSHPDEPGPTFLDERSLLEIDHGELGAIVAEHWKLPTSIVAGIRHHHDPDGAPGADTGASVPSIVHLADLVAHRLVGKGQEPPDDEFTPGLTRLGMDAMGLENLLYRTQLRLDQVGERFS